jgi:prepilin-type processing-associated H-X9-DG protein
LAICCTGDSGWLSILGGPHQSSVAQLSRLEQPGIWNFLGSPHPGAAPCLFADGAVRNLAYSLDGDRRSTPLGVE